MIKISITTLLLILATIGIADDSRPLFIQIDQQPAVLYQYQVYIKVPQTSKLPMDAELNTESFCNKSPDNKQEISDGSLLKSYQLQCSRKLNGSVVTVKINAAGSALFTLIKFTGQNQQRFSTLLKPDQARWQIPTVLTKWSIVSQYTTFGVTHMLTGYDHLLFVACVFFICQSRVRKRWKALLTTITGFTLGHSVTLGLNALGMVAINVRAVEICIALSIAFLAAEIIRHHNNQRTSLTYQYPAWVSTGFGLLHGFGFASLLNDYGLPQDQTFLGLLSFNLGIEIGQLAFVAFLVLITLALGKLLHRIKESNYSQTLKQIPIYAIGSIAMFWFFQRLLIEK